MKALQPQCAMCRHLAETGRVCEAFPAGIPDAIWNNLADHRQPFAGDGGIRFDADPAIDPAAVAALLEVHDAVRERLAGAGLISPVSPSETPAGSLE